jgi:carnitine-CoA ligase
MKEQRDGNVDLWRFLEQVVERTPDKTMLRFRDTARSYAAFYGDALAAASALSRIGVQTDDPVCLMLANSPTYLHAWFGLTRLGAVSVPLNIHLKGDGLAHIIRHSEASLVLVDAEYLPRILEIAEESPNLRTIVVSGHVDPAPPGMLSWTELVNGGAKSLLPGPVTDPSAVNGIFYTSGTTGPPKGVMLTHRAYLDSASAFAHEFVEATSEDVLYTCLPLFHVNAQAHTVLPAMLLNTTMAIGDRFSASAFWDEIRFHRVTIFNSLAAMIPILCKQPRSPSDRDHEARLTACAATPKDVWLEFEERFGVRIIEGYGLTETAGFCVRNPRNAVRVGSMGTPMDFVETRIVDTAGADVPPGERGEILLRADPPERFMEGYYRMPDKTAEAMRGGWFHTGDIGYADVDGYLYFVDRLKQSIRRRGENISSWEVEIVVNAHPTVLESAAVGVPSELGEEEVKISVVPQPGETIAPADIIAWCEKRMAYFMVPRYVDVRASLPKTATERVEKYRLKEEGIGSAWDREASGYELKRQ